jgi:hypothetical protein
MLFLLCFLVTPKILILEIHKGLPKIVELKNGTRDLEEK